MMRRLGDDWVFDTAYEGGWLNGVKGMHFSIVAVIVAMTNFLIHECDVVIQWLMLHF